MEACGGGRDDCDPMQAYWVLELINKNLDADDRFIEGAWGNWDYRMLVVLVFMMFVGMLQRKYALSVTLESTVIILRRPNSNLPDYVHLYVYRCQGLRGQRWPS